MTLVQCSKCKQWFDPKVMKMTDFVSREKNWKLCRSCLKLWSRTIWRPKIRGLREGNYQKTFLVEAIDFINGERVLLT